MKDTRNQQDKWSIKIVLIIKGALPIKTINNIYKEKQKSDK